MTGGNGRARLILLALLGSSCSPVHMSAMPRSDAPIVAFLSRSTCPAYRLTIHQDGLVEYLADRQADDPGTGWLRVSADTAEKLRAKEPHKSQSLPNENKLTSELSACRERTKVVVGFGVRRGEAWAFGCDTPQAMQADELLDLLGLRSALTSRESCDTDL